MPDHSAHLPRGHEQRAAQPQDRGGGSVLQDPLRESSHYLHRYVRASRVTPALWSRKLTFVQAGLFICTKLFRLLIKGTVSRYIFNLRHVEIHKLSTNSFLKEQYNKMFSEIRTAYHEDT